MDKYRHGRKIRMLMVKPRQARLGGPAKASAEARSAPKPERCGKMEKTLPIDFQAFQALMGVLFLTKDTFVYMESILI